MRDAGLFLLRIHAHLHPTDHALKLGDGLTPRHKLVHAAGLVVFVGLDLDHVHRGQENMELHAPSMPSSTASRRRSAFSRISASTRALKAAIAPDWSISLALTPLVTSSSIEGRSRATPSLSSAVSPPASGR